MSESPALTMLDFNNIEKYSREEIRAFLAALEEHCKNLPHVEIPCEHYHASGGSGVYARKIDIAAGQLVVGKIHKQENMNIVCKGNVTVLSIDGGVKRLKAGDHFVGSAGTKRAIFANEDSAWSTIHGTNERDLTKIEKQFIAESYAELNEPQPVVVLRTEEVEWHG